MDEPIVKFLSNELISKFADVLPYFRNRTVQGCAQFKDNELVLFALETNDKTRTRGVMFFREYIVSIIDTIEAVYHLKQMLRKVVCITPDMERLVTAHIMTQIAPSPVSVDDEYDPYVKDADVKDADVKDAKDADKDDTDADKDDTDANKDADKDADKDDKDADKEQCKRYALLRDVRKNTIISAFKHSYFCHQANFDIINLRKIGLENEDLDLVFACIMMQPDLDTSPKMIIDLSENNLTRSVMEYRALHNILLCDQVAFVNIKDNHKPNQLPLSPEWIITVSLMSCTQHKMIMFPKNDVMKVMDWMPTQIKTIMSTHTRFYDALE